MNRPTLHRFILLLLGTCLAILPQAVHACATCYGASDSAMAQGMNWGIMTLLGVIGCVLAGIVSFFVFVGRRSMTQHSTPSADSPIANN